MTRALDAIERRLSTDPLRTGAVIDIGEVARLADLDGGRPAQLIRVGLVVDALTWQTGDDGLAVYPVASRGLLSDTDLTANERMVIRRWSDDGLVEVVPAEASALGRAGEVATLLGQPLLSREQLPGYAGVRFAPKAAAGGATLDGGLGATPKRSAALGRRWECPVSDCASFGATAGPFSGGAVREGAQPPPQFVRGVPCCPRHGERLVDEGPQPLAVPMVARVEGAVCERFTVTEGRPVAVGRAPDDRERVVLGPHLGEEAVLRVSRNHLRLELRGDELLVTDLSTNGTVILERSGPRGAARPTGLPYDRPHPLGDWDVVQLFEGVELCRADRQSAPEGAARQRSVMGDAPTMAMRFPRP
nr:FHA domain-containing protein [Planosporangium thailandense]